MSYITSIGTANPPLKLSQSSIAEFMIKAMKLSHDDSRKLKTIFKASAIESRHSVINDYQGTGEFTFFSDDFTQVPSTKQRSDLFQRAALPLSLSSIKNCLGKRNEFNLKSITHLIVVSCTGMYAPGLDIDIVKAIGLSPSLHRTSVNFMGCYAAFNGIKLADSICKGSSNAKVLVVCTELCSIHFQNEATEDNFLANALFADGSASLLIESEPVYGLSLKLESFFCDLATDGENEMAWRIGDYGFEMKLSSYVPSVIQTGIQQLTNSLLKQIGIRFSELSFFAIHPGGKRILEAIEKELGMTKEQNKFAYDVLKNHGNMSSATVIFVLNELVETLTAEDENKRIMSFAFGPGLTLESMVLKIENHR